MGGGGGAKNLWIRIWIHHTAGCSIVSSFFELDSNDNGSFEVHEEKKRFRMLEFNDLGLDLTVIYKSGSS
jgi:hypothetical protein